MTPGASERIGVLCVDDQELVRDGISLIVGSQPDMDVVGSAATVGHAIELFRRHRPDVTLMDLRSTTGSGVRAIRQIVEAFPSARIIALSMSKSTESIREALKAGAVMYLSKNTPSEHLLLTIREVHAGRLRLPPQIRARLERRFLQPLLTQREIEVIDLVAQGLRNKDIAAALKIRAETVEVHLRNIFVKMNVKDRTAAVRVALERGIIDLG